MNKEERIGKIKVLLTRLRAGLDWLNTNENNPSYEQGLKRYGEIREELNKLNVSEVLINDIESEYQLNGRFIGIVSKEGKTLSKYDPEKEVEKNA